MILIGTTFGRATPFFLLTKNQQPLLTMAETRIGESYACTGNVIATTAVLTSAPLLSPKRRHHEALHHLGAATRSAVVLLDTLCREDHYSRRHTYTSKILPFGHPHILQLSDCGVLSWDVILVSDGPEISCGLR